MSDSVDPDFISALSEAVSTWRMQENVQVSFYTAYMYYFLTTLCEEFRVMGPQKWRFGRVSFTILRYGTFIFTITELTRNFRTYTDIPPLGCKVLFIINDSLYRIGVLLGDCTLGLCLAALLRAERFYLGLIMLLCLASPIMGLVFSLVGDFQYPADPIGPLDRELGYPCYIPENEKYFGTTVGGIGMSARNYIHFASSAILFALGVATFIFRYKHQKGRLTSVLRRDGGLYYLAAAAMGLGSTIVSTGSQIVSVENLESSPAYMVIVHGYGALMPILAQRLLMNMRKVDYLGSTPLASTLIFLEDKESSESGEAMRMYPRGFQSRRDEDGSQQEGTRVNAQV